MQDANNTVSVTYQRYLFNLFYLLTHSKMVTRIKKNGRIIAIIHDIFAVLIAWLLSYLILINAMENMLVANDHPAENILLFSFIYWKLIFLNLLWVVPVQFLLFKLFGLYRGFWRFASTQDLNKIVLASLLGSFIIWIVLRANDLLSHTLFSDNIIVLLYFIFLIGFLSFTRLIVRLLKDYRLHYGKAQRVIIIGAGNAGESLVRNLLRDKNPSYLPVAFVDDDLLKLGREIHNIRVVGTITKLSTLVVQYSIDLALIAMPSASSASMRSIVDACEKANITYYTLPGVKDLAKGYVSNTFRNVSLEDLLGRYPVSYQLDTIKAYLKNKIILITGGGGSIGTELCNQICSRYPTINT